MINVGETIDSRYRITEHIASGGMADVFEATDLISNRFVAVKIMKHEFVYNEFSYESFKEETKIIASLNHPNIVEICNEGMFNSCPYVVLEYVKEKSLLRKLDYLTKFQPDEAIEIMIQLLDAMSYIHSHGLLHRDIKPQNIFYFANGTIKLGDFGIATLMNNKSTKIVGSVHYIAPEVLKGCPFTVRSDIYSAGVTFYQLLTGELPYEGKTEEIAKMQVHKPFPLVSKRIPTISKNIEEILKRAVSKNPGERYLSTEAFKNDLIRYKNGTYKKDNFIKRLLRKI